MVNLCFIRAKGGIFSLQFTISAPNVRFLNLICRSFLDFLHMKNLSHNLVMKLLRVLTDAMLCCVPQVTRQMHTQSEELCRCRRELQAQTAALQRAAHDREQLAKDRAALDVKLNAAERKAGGLMQDMGAVRSECDVTLDIYNQLYFLSPHCECEPQPSVPGAFKAI